jgi:hypothetical protein
MSVLARSHYRAFSFCFLLLVFLSAFLDTPPLCLTTDLLLTDDLMAMQEEISSSSTPGHIGRIPSKIQSRFAHLTAAEWKTFGALFASNALRGRLDDTRKYDLVCKLQRVCFLLECRVLTVQQVEKIHHAIVDFCKLDEQIYGPTRQVAFHLILHLKECILDFGPIHGFWLFAYERFNGILGQIKTNNHAPESTMMHSFLVSVELHDRVHNMDIKSVPPVLRSVLQGLHDNHPSNSDGDFMSFDLCALAASWHGSDGSEEERNFGPVGSCFQDEVSVHEQQALVPFIQQGYSSHPCSPVLSPFKLNYDRFRAWGDFYGITSSRYRKASNVLVQWTVHDKDRVYPGQIQNFIQVESTVPSCSAETAALAMLPTAHLDDTKQVVAIQEARDEMARERVRTRHTFAVVKWYKSAVLRSAPGPLEATPIILTRSDLSEDVWWRDRFQDEQFSVVPVAAILGGFIQYPIPDKPAQFRLIQLPRRLFSG